MSEICSGTSRDEVLRLVPLLVAEGQKTSEAFAAGHDLHPTDADALGLLMAADADARTMTAGALGAALRITSGATTFAVNRLERAGLVRRDQDPTDQRRVLLSLSERGRDLAERFYLAVHERSQAVLAGFTDAEIETILRFLRETTRAIVECRNTFEV